MKITFLGTGTAQGIPVIACSCPVCASTDSHDKRLRTSALIEEQGINILLDAGPDFRQQMLNANVKNLNAILITHEHRDHVAGLDDVRAFNWVQRQPMDIWAEDRVLEAIQREYAYIFAERKYPGIPEVELHQVFGHQFDILGVTVIPIRVYHCKLPIFGFRIGDLTYITDGSFISEEEKDKIVGSRVLVINALRMQKSLSHFSLPEALKLVEELSPRKAYITHISHQMGFYRDVARQLPDNVFLAYDGLVVEV
ncbi:MAG: MBL fold metallo-hydrolase [Bacteroidales bacterium]|nr:MBL fold metallo-hydrolase [Bacteroidales bacterium]HNT41564.1 MBL fold metallo-hydrolase [Tenuifilaceae bacterium]MBP8643427.1 MBL fold metallo-hydrolase [Bacteroidales bacterium]NLI88653.1 MBL fold metallo-hydrolase [Bacteroidales bacterium]HOA09222.1 MBL fold metallo-hydrolase [Tenuifilaceae bacterium]